MKFYTRKFLRILRVNLIGFFHMINGARIYFGLNFRFRKEKQQQKTFVI